MATVKNIAKKRAKVARTDKSHPHKILSELASKHKPKTCPYC